MAEQGSASPALHMSPFSELSVKARSYVTAVAAFGGIVLLTSVRELSVADTDARWFVLVILTLLTSSVTVKVPSVAATLSISEAFVFAAVILFGWPGGTVLASLDGLVISLWLHRRRPQPAYRLAFNATGPALATYLAYWVYAALGAPSIDAPDFHITQILLPICGFAAAYFLSNSFLIAAAIALEQNQSAVRVWSKNFTWLSINYFSGASMAALLVAFGGQRDADGNANALGAVWIVLPLLAITYFTYKSSMARIEDANKHVEQLNTLYLSTIETLAMAIDAKDQITHGHIRRVQTFAVALAKEVGITDQTQIRAIEAAALLHDMGKLAVPEYILNKPGPLTPAEFERMKLHAAAGADILSAIDFPYPVVPIVRHHHENWDGTGYPAGLKGTDIPIGARVLSVVDCFDALTSDRPYRPRLSDEDALQVVTDRRGRMYDPLIVDSFLRLYARLKEQPQASLGPDTGVGRPVLTLPTSSPRLAAISASAGESRAMYRLIQRLAAQHSLPGAFADVTEEVAALIPATAVAMYTLDSESDDLEVTHVYGGYADWLKGRRVRLGERVVGWSASSGRSVLNADATAELGEVARSESSFANCMTVPISVGGERLGVIVAFSSAQPGFRQEDQRIVEAVVKHIAPVLERLRPRQPSAAVEGHRDLELTPPGMLACRCSASPTGETETVGLALAVIRRQLAREVLAQIVSGSDIFTSVGTANDEKVELLAGVVRSALLRAGLISSEDKVVIATTPKDGTNLEHLLYACRQRLGAREKNSRVVH